MKTANDQVIKDSFRELVMELPIEKITVSAICERAGIARKTFYVYFQTRDEVLEAIIKDDTCESTVNLYPLFGSSQVEFSAPFLYERFFQGFCNHKEFYARLAQRSHSHTFVRSLQRCMYELNESLFPTAPKETSVRYRYANRFLISGQASIIVQWIREGMGATPKEMSAMAWELNTPAVWIVGNPDNPRAKVEYELK